MEDLDIDSDPTLLTFGCVLAIADFQDQNAYITSDGFLKTNILLKNFVKKAQKGKNEALKNNSFFNCLFQVVPKVSDTTKSTVLKRIDYLEKQHNVSRGLQPQIHYETENQEDYSYANRYKIRDINDILNQLMNEYKYNLDSMDKSKLQKLSYHQPFQLMHVASSRFLACHEIESRYENQNYKLQLDDFSSEATVFNVVPAFKYQKDGEQDVNAGEMCAITRANPISNKTTYVHCSNSEISDIKQQQPSLQGGTKQQQQPQYQSQPQQGDFTIYKREVNASVEEGHSWKVILFQHYIPDSSKYLKVGDCIWLHHSEAEATLAVQKKLNAVDKYTFKSIDLSHWLSLSNLEVAVLGSHGNEGADHYNGSTNGLWQVEGSDFSIGGYLEFDKAFRLRHLSTGFYLQVIPNPAMEKQKVSKRFHHLFALSEVPDRSTLFEFVELKTLTADKYAKSGSYIYIKNIQYKKWIDFYKHEEVAGGGHHHYKGILKQENERTEHAVFKLHVATKNEVWEINYLLSSFRMLAKFLLSIQHQSFPGVDKFAEKKQYLPKMFTIQECIKNLDDFVNNKQYNSSMEQQYGHINPSRQKLLKEQFYIEILVKILSRIICKGELELWQRRHTLLAEDEPRQDMQMDLLEDGEEEIQEDAVDDLKYVDKLAQSTKQSILEYVGRKIELCNQIYKFLGSVCKFNPTNQVHTYELIPYFQLQTKYLPTSIDTIIDIVSSNKKLLIKLSDGLKIDFDYLTSKELVEDHTKKIKILINLYEGEEIKDEAQLPQEEKINFRQHEKITSKPINLINYFVNLIWDDEAWNNSDYLKFLRSVSRYQNESITLNQENLFKLYKRYNDVKPKLGVETKAEETKQTDGTVRLMSKAGQLIIPQDCDKNTGRKKFNYIIEQLTFFSEVAYGRNFLWKKELGAQFEKSFLFRNIWNTRPMDGRYEDLKPCFAKIAQTLYIDQEPLIEKSYPVLCRLFANCDQGDDFRVFRSTVDNSQNLQELNTYNDLVLNMMAYFEDLKSVMKNELENDGGGGINKEEDIGRDLLQKELIFNTVELLQMLFKLDLFQVLEYSFEKAPKAQPLYGKLLEILLYLFQYEKFQLKFVKAHVQTFNEEVKKERDLKKQKNQLVPGMLKFGGGKKPIQDEDDLDDNKGEQSQTINEQNLYINPIMRGYIKFANILHSFNYMDQKHIQNELNLKLKICDILDWMLDLRQNYLMQNALVFFKYYVLKGEHEENDEHQLKRILRRENKGKKVKLLYEEVTQDMKDQMMITRLLKVHQLGLLPNIAKTGIKSVDEPQNTFIYLISKKDDEGDPFAAFKKLKNIQMFDQKKIENFNDYIQDQKIEGIPPFYDLDQYLSMELQDPTPFQNPIASCLPTLLNTYTQITDPALEKRCIGVMMRLFNQNHEFKQNLRGMQVIFDREKTILYHFVKKHIKSLNKHVERANIWFTTLQKGQQPISVELEECTFIIKNLNSGLFADISLVSEQIKNNSNQIDDEKQTLQQKLKVHIPIIALIKSGMPYLSDLMLDADVHVQKKLQLIKAFNACFDYLKNFCKSHFDNQLLLYEHIDCFTNYLQFDLGQVVLLIEMFMDNKVLLVQRVDVNFIQIFTGLVEREGRQELFLDICECIMQFKNRYIFDNQLIVLNTILPHDLTDRSIKVLYADGMKEKEIRFFINDVVYSEKDSFIKKMEDVDFKDTFRDEPFRYHSRLLDVLLQTTLVSTEARAYKPELNDDSAKDNFNISVGKLKKFFKAEYLLELLRINRENDSFVRIEKNPKDLKRKAQEKQEKPEDEDQKLGFTIIKQQVIEFLRQIHITSERGSILNSELYHCQGSVAGLFDFENKRLDQLNGIDQIKDGFVDYYFKGLLPFSIAYFQRFLKKLQESQQGEDDRKDTQNIDRFARLLLSKILKLGVMLSPFIDNAYNAQVLDSFYKCFPSVQYDKLMALIKSEDAQKDQEQLKMALKLDRLIKDQTEEEYFRPQEEIVIGNSQMDEELEINEEKYIIKQEKPKHHYHHHSKKSKNMKDPQQIKEEEEQFKKGFLKQDAKKVEGLWERFTNELLTNEKFEEQEEKERVTIANAIMNISKLLNPQFSKQVTIKPDVKLLSKKIILFLQSAFNDPSCKITIDTILKILKQIIEKEEDEEKKMDMQKSYDRLGATQMVLLVLSENNKFIDKKMLESFLIFINTLLEGGNQVVQQTIYDFMINYSQSETIFQKINMIIRKQIENVEIMSKFKKNKRSQGKDASIGILSIDEKEYQEDLTLMNQVLKFLQNSVEGHYLKLQNYLRQQTNSRNNYDLINAVTELLKTYYYEDCCQSNFDNMIKCLDTLNELVQGPCPENQIAVSESKFFDIASDLFSKKKKLPKGQQIGMIEEVEPQDEEDSEKLPPWMVSRLQNKVVMLILSLMEDREINENNQVLKRIMRNLPLSTLERHLAKSYNKFRNIYKDKYPVESLEHLTKDPRRMSQKELKNYHPKYFETVLQNGFLIFFLVSYYMECDPSIESPVVQIHKAFKKNILKPVLMMVMQPQNFFKIHQQDSYFNLLSHYLNHYMESQNVFSYQNYFEKAFTSLAADQFKGNEVSYLNEEQKEKLKQKKFKEMLEGSVNFYLQNSAHIDVVHGEQLEIVYFIKLPYTQNLPKEKKNQFHENVDRSTTQTKVSGLVEEADNLIEVCKHEENLKILFQKQKFLALFTNYVKLWQEFAFYLTLFLNLIILFSFDGTKGDRIHDYIFFNVPTYTISETKAATRAIGVAMTCCAIFVVTYYLLKNAPLILKRAWRQKGLFEDQDSTNIIFWLIDLGFKMFSVLIQFLQEIEVMYYIAYGIFAVLGTIIHPFFFIFHLSEILFRYPTLLNIIQAIWQPRVQLVLAIFLFMILIYLFALIAYMFLYEQFMGYCDNLLYCFMLCIDWTIRGSIGGYLTQLNEEINITEKFGFGRFFFDELSNIFLVFIMLGIVGGIIIDTFGSLREQENEKHQDKTDKCFICGNLKADLDRSESTKFGGFREHIKINHYMWNYLYFIAYLKWKDKTEYSGIESFVASKLEEEDLCWIPFNQARELKVQDQTEGQGEEEMIQDMEQRIANVQDQIKEMAKVLKVNYKNK